MQISAMTKEDFKQFWPTFQAIVDSQETYAFDPDINFDAAYDLWCLLPQKTYVAKENDVLLGSYYLKPNGQGPSSHICNCGYMVVQEGRGKGVAKKMCLHSQEVAVNLGYRAMQFNSVVSSNKVAINLWKKLGYEVIGVIPEAYNHKQLGFVDSFIMYKKLLINDGTSEK